MKALYLGGATKQQHRCRICPPGFPDEIHHIQGNHLFLARKYFGSKIDSILLFSSESKGRKDFGKNKYALASTAFIASSGDGSS